MFRALFTGSATSGVMYLNGRGVPQDDVTAHMWLNLAGAQGLEEAREIRDRLAAPGAGVERGHATTMRRARAILARVVLPDEGAG